MRERAACGGYLAALTGVLALALANPAGAYGDRDWSTYGFRAGRSGVNPNEHSLGRAGARSLTQVWATPLGGYVDAQPLVEFGVAIAGGARRDLVYAGSEGGRFAAVDAATGVPVWTRELGAVDVPSCEFTYGISDTPAIDRARGSVYVASGTGYVYELDLATGATRHRWRITTDASREHVWGALTLSRGRLYVPVAGTCDLPPYRGRVVAFDTRTARRSATWYVTGRFGPDGGGIWGWGGLSADATHNALYAATGNAFPRATAEHARYGEHVVRLTGKLHVKSSDDPDARGFDADFGATPVLYHPHGCPPELAVGNKYGQFFVYDRDRLSGGPVQHLVLGGSGDGGHALLGVASYWRAARTLYVANPNRRGPFPRGILAFRVNGHCRLALRWHAPGPGKLTSSPTIANGVLYYGTGRANRVVALDARTGKRLWRTATGVTGAVYNAPSVAGGTLYVGSWDGKVHAFRTATQVGSADIRR